MSHPSQLAFFQIAIASFPEQFSGSVLDVGSLDINGGPHMLLNSETYVGVDLADGPNVNFVSSGENLDFGSGTFDVSMSSECFEHNANWQATLHNMIRMTKSGGLIAFTCASTGRPEHGTTRSDAGYSAPLAVALGHEHYANVTEKMVKSAVQGAPLDSYFIYTNKGSCDLFFLGLKTGISELNKRNLAQAEKLIDIEFRNTKYPGKIVRRLAISVLGDRGQRMHDALVCRIRNLL